MPTAAGSVLSASTRRYLDAYADGVNAYLQSHSPADISLEYSLLGLQGLDYSPEPWTAVDSLAWVKAMAWDLGANMDREVETSLMLAIAPERVAMSRAAPCPFSPTGPLRGPLSPDDPTSPNYSPSGSFGDPTLASAEKGRNVLAAILHDLREAAA